MGNVRLGVPEQLVLALKEASGIDTFIETGTYKGGTARWAAEHFKWIGSVEGYEPRYLKTRATIDAECLPNRAGLVLAFGDSRTVLRELLTISGQPAIIWLDAHWCGEGAHDCNGDECPLMEELSQINASEHAAEHIILIDDARLFTSPPPYPHDPKQWPTIVQIEDRAGIGLDNYPINRVGAIAEDVIACAPRTPEYANLLDRWKAGEL